MKANILLSFLVDGQGPAPPQEEIQEMEEKASMVVKLLEELRNYIASGSTSGLLLAPKTEDTRTGALAPQPEAGRAPKRPWEDVSGDEDNLRSGPYPPQVSELLSRIPGTILTEWLQSRPLLHPLKRVSRWQKRIWPLFEVSVRRIVVL